MSGIAAGMVRTVLGDVPAAQLGHTQPHEHLLIDLRPPGHQQMSPDEHAAQMEPVTLANYYRTRREHRLQDLLLDDETVALEALADYRRAGGSTLVDVTSIGLGRRPAGLRRLSQQSGVHVVMGSSYYYRDYHPTWLDRLSVDAITTQIVADIETGEPEHGVSAGIIGEVGLSWPHHRTETAVLRASALASAQTGAALSIHPARDARSPIEAVRTAVSVGADPQRIIMSHIDRTLFNEREIMALADTGCYLAFDLFGQETSYYSLGAIDMPNDASRLDWVRTLIGYGHGERVLLSQDVCHKTNVRTYGGEGYSHILDHVLPLMVRKGFSQAEIKMLTVSNPARVLAAASGDAS